MRTIEPEKEGKALSIWFDAEGNVKESYEYTRIEVLVPECSEWKNGEAHWQLETYS